MSLTKIKQLFSVLSLLVFVTSAKSAVVWVNTNEPWTITTLDIAEGTFIFNTTGRYESNSCPSAWSVPLVDSIEGSLEDESAQLMVSNLMAAFHSNSKIILQYDEADAQKCFTPIKRFKVVP